MRIATFRSLVSLPGVFLLVLVAGATALAACGGEDDTTPLPDPNFTLDSGAPPAEEEESTTGGSTTGGAADAGPPPAHLRVAHLAVGVQGVDVCVRAGTSGPFQGPLVASALARATGILYAQVSAHADFVAPATAGSHQIRIVAAGGGCDGEAGAPLASTTLSVAAGGYVTVVLTGEEGGEGEIALKAVAMSDTRTASRNAVALRAFHAVADAPALDVQLGALQPLTGIRYGSAQGFPYTTASGFAQVTLAGSDAGYATAEGTPLRFKAGTQVVGAFASPALDTGAVVTVFLGGRVAPPGPGVPPLAAIACFDTQAGGEPSLASCRALTKL